MSIDTLSPEPVREALAPTGTGDIGVGRPLDSFWPRFGSELLRSLRAQSIFIVIVLTHVLAALLLPAWFGVSIPYSATTYITTMVGVTAIAAAAFMVAYTAAVVLAVKPSRLLPYIWTEMTGRMLPVERLAQALLLLAIFPVFAATFSYFKIAIPAFNPFSWDIRLADWDRSLHGGLDPWELMQPLLGHPFVTAALNAAYHAWFGVTYGAILWLMVDTQRPRLCMRYLLTFVLIWILLGNLAATVFSSAGPVYYGRVTGVADQFAPLMGYLHAANHVVAVPALDVQELLWHWYKSGSFVAGAGISAMPSLHVGVAFSFFLVCRAIDGRLALAAGIFAAITLVASVHLGWHYAIDGYAAIVGAWFIWIAVGRLLELPAVVRLLWGEEGTPTSTAASLI
ncbi:MAG TPA: phosphatase PAP2 family protein [Methylomirabilota bacterium]|nr:phosphatase PAP2 family protein [Methylomirabilota bacterium]